MTLQRKWWFDSTTSYPPQKQTCETVLIKQVQHIVMNYLTLQEIKKHLNIDNDFTDDDSYIESLGEVAEEIVKQHVRKDLFMINTENRNKLPAPIKQAMLLLIGNYYANRESVTYAAAKELPQAYEYLLSPYVSYGFTNI